MRAGHAHKRLLREMATIGSALPPFCTAAPVGDNLFQWLAVIRGPENTPYFGGVFNVDITIPEAYPFKPPAVKFGTPIHHPNISAKGEICTQLLENWSPSSKLADALGLLCTWIAQPEPDYSMNLACTQEYRRNRDMFEQNARRWTLMHARSKEKEAKQQPVQAVIAETESVVAQEDKDCPIVSLPNELLTCIFSHLGLFELTTSRLVCKSWRQTIFEDDFLWNNLTELNFAVPPYCLSSQIALNRFFSISVMGVRTLLKKDKDLTCQRLKRCKIDNFCGYINRPKITSLIFQLIAKFSRQWEEIQIRGLKRSEKHQQQSHYLAGNLIFHSLKKIVLHQCELDEDLHNIMMGTQRDKFKHLELTGCIPALNEREEMNNNKNKDKEKMMMKEEEENVKYFRYGNRIERMLVSFQILLNWKLEVLKLGDTGINFTEANVFLNPSLRCIDISNSSAYDAGGQTCRTLKGANKKFSREKKIQHDTTTTTATTTATKKRKLKLNFDRTGVTDKGLRMIFKQINHESYFLEHKFNWLGALRHLSLAECQISDEGFRVWNDSESEARGKVMATIQKLNLSRCLNLTDKGMKLIGRKLGHSLKILRLHGIKNITDVGLRRISKFCTSLKELDVSSTSITDDGLEVACPKLGRTLKSLNVSECSGLSHKGMIEIAHHLPKLKLLKTQFCFLDGEALRAILIGCKKLKNLQIGYTNIDENVFKVKDEESFSSVKTLSLRGCKVTDASLSHIAVHFPSLQSLDIANIRGNSNVSEEGIGRLLKECPSIRELDLYFCNDISTQLLSSLSSLHVTVFVSKIE